MPLPVPSPLPSRGGTGWRRETAAALLVVLAVASGWLFATGRWRAAAWNEPLIYQGDALYYFAMAQASAESSAVPFLWKHAARLNAPSGADWNDFPIVNEPLWSLLGIARRFFGLAGVSHYPVLLAHLLAGLGFYAAARCWAGSRASSAALALLFALSPYLLVRSFQHLNLAFAWHVPLAAVVALWAAQEQGLATRRRYGLGLAVAVCSGLQATYYALFFLLLLAGALAAHAFARRFAQLPRPTVLGLVTATLALAGNLDTITFGLAHGRNPNAVERSIEQVELYALKPVELFLPRNNRLDSRLGAWSERTYFSHVPATGESAATYLGLVAGGALLILMGAALASLIAPGRWRPPPEAWAALVALAFGVSGGANTALGIAGVQVFRVGCRVSVLLLALALLFAARSIAAWPLRRQVAALTLLVGLGLVDQIPPRNLERQATWAWLFAADAALAAELERTIPGGRIFQLPVALYPEAPRVGELEPYDLLRLYSHSGSLQFTYGAHKGRGFERWQQEIVALPWPEAIARLRSMGFSAIAVYGRAYDDRGAAVVAAIEAAGGGPTLAAGVQSIRVILLPKTPAHGS